MGLLSTVRSAMRPAPARSFAGSTYVDWTGLNGRNSTGATWDRSAAAMRCVLTTASNLAAVPMVVVRDGETQERHPVAELWNASVPGQGVSARTVRQVLFARAELKGEAFAYLPRETESSLPFSIVPLFGQVQVLVEGKAGEPSRSVVGFRVKPDNASDWIGLLPSEVLWLRYPHPEEEWGALAPWRAALHAVSVDNAARSWQEAELLNQARPSSVIYLGDVDEDTYVKAKAEFTSQVQGYGNAGKSLLIAGGAQTKVDRIGLTPAEMSYLESRTANTNEVLLAFGYRPDYFLGGATYENQRAAKAALWSDVLLEKLDVLGSEIDRQLLPDPVERAGFDVSEVDALRESQDAVVDRLTRLVVADLPTINEAREELGLPPLPDGDVTLTEWRERIKALYASPAPTPTRIAFTQASLRAAPRLIRVGGTTTTVRKRKRRRLVPATHILAAYEVGEAAGRRVIAELAARQEKRVLHELSRFLGRSVDSFGDHLTHATSNRMEVAEGIMGAGCECARMVSDQVFDTAYWHDQTIAVVTGWLQDSWNSGGAAVAGAMGIDFDTVQPGLAAAMRNRALVLADQVTQTTRRVLDSAMVDAMAADGASVDTIAAAVKQVFSDLSTSRAKTIARTETVGGYNAAARLTASQSGVVMDRQWLSTHDSRTRHSHVRVNGETLHGFENRYSNGLLHPGDPSGPPGETINCRCTELFLVGD